MVEDKINTKSPVTLLDNTINNSKCKDKIFSQLP